MPWSMCPQVVVLSRIAQAKKRREKGETVPHIRRRVFLLQVLEVSTGTGTWALSSYRGARLDDGASS